MTPKAREARGGKTNVTCLQEFILEAMTSPTHDDLEDLLLSCRYGELDEVKSFVQTYGAEPVSAVRDENGNTVLHMCCGNGHTGARSGSTRPPQYLTRFVSSGSIELLDYLLTIVPPSLLSVSNNSKSTALHWATTNKHMEVVQKLVNFPDGPGPALVDQKNLAGLTAVGEAEMVEWDEGARWLVGVMSLETAEAKEEDTAAEEVPVDEDAEGTMEVDDQGTTPTA